MDRMFPIPMIQITQQYAKIGFDADLGAYDIKQPRPTVEITTTPAKVDIRSPRGDLNIDQSKAWDALGVGSNLDLMNLIYSQSKSIALQGIVRIVEDGNRMGAIHLDRNPIGDIAWDRAFGDLEPIEFPSPSYDSVDIQYTPRKPEINVELGNVVITSHPNQPQINYIKGKMNVYMEQYNSIEIIPPKLDLQI